MELPRPRRSRPPIPPPRSPHPYDKADKPEQAESSPSIAAKVGEVATSPDQTRLKAIVKAAEAAARAHNEAGGSAETEVEFESKTGEDFRDKSEEAAQAAAKLGINDNVEVFLTYAFASDQGPASAILHLMEQPEGDDYTVVQILEHPPTSEGGRERYETSAETVGDSNSGILPEHKFEVNEQKNVPTLSDEEMAAYMAASKNVDAGKVEEKADNDLAKEWANRSKARELTSGEIESVAVISQAILDLQPPLPGHAS